MANRWIKSYAIDPDHPLVGIKTGMTGYWLDLIQLAAGVDGYQGLGRGQLRASRAFLSDRWPQLTPKQIRGFLERLVHAEMLKIEPNFGAKNSPEKGQRTGQGRGRCANVYLIVNYEKYQGGVDLEANKAANDGAKNSVEKGHKERKRKEIKDNRPTVFVDSTVDPGQKQVDLEEAIAATKTDVEKVADLWNELADKTGLAKVTVLSDSRKRAINARLKEAGGLDGVKQVIDYIATQPVLLGKQKFSDGRTWKASFDYLVRPEKFAQNLDKARATQQFAQAPQKRRINDWGEGW
jgi:hypothetical protein